MNPNAPPRRYVANLPAGTAPQLREAIDHILNSIALQRSSYGPTSLLAESPQGQPVQVALNDTGIGLAVQFNRPGQWLLQAAVCLKIVGDSSKDFTLSLSVNGTTEQRKAISNVSADQTVMMHQSWVFSSQSGNESARLLIKKASAGGTSSVQVAHSSLSASWQGS